MPKFSDFKDVRVRLVSGVAWLTATRIIANLAALASTVVLGRLLSPSDFGLVAMGTSIIALLNSFADLSLRSALIHHQQPSDEHFHSVWSANVIRGIVLMVLIDLCAVPISTLFGDSRLVPILIVVGAAPLISGLANPRLALFSRDLVFWQEFVLTGGQKLVGLTVALGWALIFNTYWALVAGFMSTEIFATVCSYILRRYRPRFLLSALRELMSFSIWLSLDAAVNEINWRVDQLLVGYFLKSATLGFYTVGSRLALMPARESTAPLAQTLFPGFTRIRDNRRHLRTLYLRAQSVIFALALPSGCGFAMIAKPLIVLTMGVKWLPAAMIVQYLAVAFALQSITETLHPLALALGKTRQLLYRDAVLMGIRVPLVIAGLLTGGLMGVVYARCISSLLGIFVSMVMLNSLIGISPKRQIAFNSRTILAVAVMMATIGVLEKIIVIDTTSLGILIKMLISIVGAVLVYASVLYILWRVAGRPKGPETEAVALFSRFSSSFCIGWSQR
jgi:lipopolysaccharide exporter